MSANLRSFSCILVIFFLSGCSALNRALNSPKTVIVPVVQTNLVTTITTNVINQTTQTNLFTVTNTVAETKVVYRTNEIWSVKPAVTSTLATVSTLANTVPNPYGGLVSVIAGGVGAMGALLAAWKNGQKNEALAQLTAVVVGVENAVRDGLPVKPAIKEAAKKAGVQPELDHFVQSVT